MTPPALVGRFNVTPRERCPLASVSVAVSSVMEVVVVVGSQRTPPVVVTRPSLRSAGDPSSNGTVTESTVSTPPKYQRWLLPDASRLEPTRGTGAEL